MAKNENTDKPGRPKRTSLILCTALQTIGWIFLVDTAVLFIQTVTGPRLGAIEDKGPFEVLIFLSFYWFSIDFFFIGIAVVILGQLARFIFQKDGQPGLLLRWGSKILVVFACLVLFWAVFCYLSVKPSGLETHKVVATLLAFVAPAAIKAAILILIAQILKRILPIIEESKVLV